MEEKQNSGMDPQVNGGFASESELPAPKPAMSSGEDAAATPAAPPDSAPVGVPLEGQAAVSTASPTAAPVPVPAKNGSMSGLAIAGLVLGVLALLGSIIPVLNILTAPFGVLGLLLAAVGLVGIGKGEHTGKGLAIAGIILSGVALVVTIGMYGCASAVSSSAFDRGPAGLGISSASTQDASIGTWDIVGMTLDDDTVDEDAIRSASDGEDSFLNVNEDGTVVSQLFGSVAQGKWERTGDDELSVTYGDGTAVISFDGDDAVFTFNDSWVWDLRRSPTAKEPKANADASQEAPGVPTLGSTVKFDDLQIAFGDAVSTTTVGNQFSEHHGATVIAVPVTITNLSDSTHGLNMFYLKAFGPSGTELDDVSAYFQDDDAKWAGDMRAGASQQAVIHLLYEGDGTYFIQFKDFTEEVEVEIPVAL